MKDGKLINNSPRLTFLLKASGSSILALYVFRHGKLLHFEEGVATNHFRCG